VEWSCDELGSSMFVSHRVSCIHPKAVAEEIRQPECVWSNDWLPEGEGEVPDLCAMSTSSQNEFAPVQWLKWVDQSSCGRCGCGEKARR